MNEYYEIIGRKKKEPIKKRVASGMNFLLMPIWIGVCVLLAVYFACQAHNIGVGLAAFLCLCLFGFFVIPVFAFAMKDLLAISICVFFVVYLITMLYLGNTKRKLTNKERIQEFELQLKESEFESAYPDAKKLKEDYKSVKEAHEQAKTEIKKALAATSKKEILADYKLGRISKSECDRLIEYYKMCEFRASIFDQEDQVTAEILDAIKNKISGYIEQFEK